MEGQCAFCGLSNQVRICKNPDTGKGPQFCSTLLYPECIEKAALYLIHKAKSKSKKPS